MDIEIINYLREDAQELAREHHKASKLGKGSSDEVAEFREIIFKSVLEKYFPNTYKIGKGIIRDSNGNSGPSIDVVVMHPDHPRLARRESKNDLILANGVEFVIEIKPDLSRKDEITRGLEQIRKVKKLLRTGDITKGDIGIIDNDINNISKRIPCIIWSEKTYTTLEKLSDVIEEHYKKENVPLDEQVDLIFVNGLGIINIAKHGLQSIVKNGNPGAYIEEYGENTLAALIHRICVKIIPSFPYLRRPIIHSHLEGLQPDSVKVADAWPGIDTDEK
ncbi:MAG: hypothetical protein IMY67_11400 [Bacteroidetes bacterium]|nr:hypothetical protein [Bacteroidota bacterium]